MKPKMQKTARPGVQPVVVTAEISEPTPGEHRGRVDRDGPTLNRRLGETIVFDTGAPDRHGLVWIADESVFGRHLVSFAGKSEPCPVTADATCGDHDYGFLVATGGKWLAIEGHASPPKIKIIDRPPTRTDPGGR